MPKFLSLFWPDLSQISLAGCLLQMYSINFSIVIGSGLVLGMALDRFVAISRPLHNHQVVTKHFLIWVNGINAARGFLLVSPIVLSLIKVDFCRSNTILSFACENMGLLNLGCGDISRLQVIGLVVRISVPVLDGGILLISYMKILYAAMKLVSGKAQDKAFSTCGTHLVMAFVIYSCELSSSIVYRISWTVSVNV
ncbi:hypothetical protein GDO86_004526 [Hymenochirus boettgeri]|uniref:G-protein coupled receptors family 1 profile domain-containing protein n=1 Tax=Hymenochirus boettgeri TaxID=247094 RepID=A0A8T2KBL5_9PIPI|nr:hypothetical protein GDO86_004526 [Hymenochirus boettgeri]